jgi:acyl-CoA synthetase
MPDSAGRDWSRRLVPEELRKRYFRDGHWTDDTLGSVLATAIHANPALPFRVWSEQRPSESTVGEVYEQACRLACGLRARGIGPGDVLAFQLPNWIEAASTFFAASVLGALLVPVVYYYGAKELGFALRESRARALITTDRFRRIDYAAQLATLRPTLPDLELIVMVPVAGAPLPRDVTSFEQMTACEPLREVAAVDPDSVAVIAYTSGTTADPKGVIHSHRSLLAEIRQLAAVQPTTERPTLIGAPVAHAIGMLGGLLLPVYRRQAVHLTDTWNATAVLDAMLSADLSAGNGATAFLLSLLDSPHFTPAHAAKMAFIGLGGAPVPRVVAERAEALGIKVARAYGSTEHPSTTGSSPDAPRDKRNYTDGRALAGVELRLVDERGRDVGPGTPGEIWSRGPDLFTGYTDAALMPDTFSDDGWYQSGDIGVLDEDGYLTITDRKKDIIIRGGANISAAEIEELVMRLPGVSEVAVVAAPDHRLGEHACAFVRLQPGAAAPDLPTVRRHLQAAGLARPKWPEELRIVDDFPRTASGKIKKYALRASVRAERVEPE